LIASLPFAIALFLAFPFPVQKQSGFAGWILFFYQGFARVLIPWFSITAVTSTVQFRRKRLIHSNSDALRLIWALIFSFPLLFTYVILVFAALFVPVFEWTPWLDPVQHYWLTMLLFTPFVFIFFSVFTPLLPPRKMVKHAWKVLKGEEGFPEIKFLQIIEAVFLAGWLLIVFLPFLEPPFKYDLAIAGGVVASAILYKDKIRRRTGRKK
jgi:hypothetical protein